MWHVPLEQVLQLGLTGRVDKPGQPALSNTPRLQAEGGAVGPSDEVGEDGAGTA
jgi:hypothetical protein